MILLLFAGAGLILALLYCVAESVYERDWPRSMVKYVAIFAIIAAVTLFIV